MIYEAEIEDFPELQNSHIAAVIFILWFLLG